ncbi:hypothetical protein FIBSPDRAFT_838150 [Athelia psychrophila]|uniref:DUF92-domain-containing protein n=1 Tax=Athelia psychrophila TaxID=1759441 RepID=A0A165ZMH7_9AGAM|nr:hypothetical protein FIBSPDRAFT_838150 [Fibularhizoctonia sp. CBS 109695]
MTGFPLTPLLVATALSLHGLKKKSLSPSGSLAAFAIGFLMLASPLRVFGVSLIVFYLTGSRATKYGKTLKMTLEDGFQEAGYRTAWQVLCNSFSAFVAAVIWSVLFAPGSIPRAVASYAGLEADTLPYTSEGWCPLSPRMDNGASRALLFAVLGHFACCCGDTLASELGILSPTKPILITTLKTVPPGTNGGMSLGGTLASLVGGLIMGVTVFVDLIVENRECRGQWMHIVGPLVLWGIFAGGVGSLLDSFLGATVQRSRYSVDTKRVLQDHSEHREGADIKVISGMNILTNNQVNLVSSIATSILLAKLA